MRREVDMREISDGNLYTSSDMVKAECGNCEGCHACCCDMGQSIVLDPLDIARLEWGLKVTFEELLVDKIELNVVDGVILPNLKMDPGKNQCNFLNEEGRCSIHSIRPGICRLFPLGRYYENGGFKYFLQTKECKKENRTKVKVKKWLDTPNLKEYEAYICRWHYFLKDVEIYLAKHPEEMKELSMYILTQFYLIPFKEEEDFYPQLEKRVAAASKKLENH